MSVERVTYLIVTCDGCGDLFEPTSITVSAARREARVAGWSRRHAGKPFVDDLCPGCSKT